MEYKLLEISDIDKIVRHIKNVDTQKSIVNPLLFKEELVSEINIRNGLFNYESMYFAEIEDNEINKLLSFKISKEPLLMKKLTVDIYTNFDEKSCIMDFAIEKIKKFLSNYNKIILYLPSDFAVEGRDNFITGHCFKREVILKNELEDLSDLIIYSRNILD